MKFKVGDNVRIVKFKTGVAYPFGFNSGMQEYSGKVARITKAFETARSGTTGSYRIDLDEVWSWSDPMFEEVESAEDWEEKCGKADKIRYEV